MHSLPNQIIEVIKRSNNILLMPSSPPDGDSIGSSLALYLALRKLGKHATVVCADPIPDVYDFLPMMSAIESEFAPAPDFIVTLDCAKAKIDSLQSKVENDKVNIIITAQKGQFSAEDISFSHGPNKYDLIITVDTAATQQLGRFYEDNPSLFSEVPVINIDHHASNEGFGRINWVDIMSSSTTELILTLFQKMEENLGQKIIDEDIATLLLSGVITDTGSFQNSNTTPRSFAAAASLIRHGARQQEIIQHIFKTKQLSTLKLWGRILTNIRNEEKYRLVWSVITKKDLLETGSKEDETGGIIDELLSNAPNTDVVVLLKEKDGKILSGSVRSTTDQVDASAIAGMFDGGGHIRAAGFKIKDADFESHGREVIEKIKEFQASRLNLEEFQAQKQQEITENLLQESTQQVPTNEPEKEMPIKQEPQVITKTSTKVESGVKYKFEE